MFCFPNFGLDPWRYSAVGTAQSVRNGVVKGPNPLIPTFQSSHHVPLQACYQIITEHQGWIWKSWCWGFPPHCCALAIFALGLSRGSSPSSDRGTDEERVITLDLNSQISRITNHDRARSSKVQLTGWLVHRLHTVLWYYHIIILLPMPALVGSLTPVSPRFANCKDSPGLKLK